MRFISQLVRRATTRPTEPKARTRGKSPRARLRADALNMFA